MRVFVTDKYRVLTFLLICTVIGMGAIFAGEDSVTVSTAPKIVPIYSVGRDDGKIAITFDCAWGAEDMESILSTLKNHNCKATFFVLGTWAEQNPDTMKKLVADGHEIGNHSYNHTDYTAMSQNEMLSDIDKCNKAIKDTSGISPTLFRAPSGDYNNSVIETVHSKNMEYIQWSVDSLDWRGLNCEQMLERIIPKTQSGDILLFHNDTAHTAESLDKILTELEKKGFSFLKVSDLIYKDNYTIDHTGRQIKN
jgi:polysaccharide deacetylase family sporulation protein PdaB